MKISSWLKVALSGPAARYERTHETGDLSEIKLLLKSSETGLLETLMMNPAVPEKLLVDRALELEDPYVRLALLKRRELSKEACLTLASCIDRDMFEEMLLGQENVDEEVLWALLRRALGENIPRGKLIWDLAGTLPPWLPKVVLKHPLATKEMFEHAFKRLKNSNALGSDMAVGGIVDAGRAVEALLKAPAVSTIPEIKLADEIHFLTYRDIVRTEREITFEEFMQLNDTIRTHRSVDMIMTFIRDGWEGEIKDLLKTVEALDADH